MLLLRWLAATPNVGIRNGILLARWKTSGWPVKSWTTMLDPHDGTEFVSLVDLFCRVAGHLPRGHEYTDDEVIGVLTRFTDIGLAHTEWVSFEVARTLVHSFECVVVGVKQDTNYSPHILNTPESYANHVVGKSRALHYKLLKLLVKTFPSCPAEQQLGYAKEIISILWLGPAFLAGKSWKEICVENGTPISQHEPLAIAEDASSSPDPEISQVITILRLIVEELEKLAQPTNEDGTPTTLDPASIKAMETCIGAIRSKLPESTRDLRVITCIPFIELACHGVSLVVNTNTAEGGD
jgi:hypothetical protein